MNEIIGFITLGLAIIGGYVKLRERIVALETKIEIFWKNVSFDAAKILHTPHEYNARRDYLLEKFLEEKINRTELIELVDVLKDIIINKSLEFGERAASSVLLRAIEQRYNLY